MEDFDIGYANNLLQTKPNEYKFVKEAISFIRNTLPNF